MYLARVSTLLYFRAKAFAQLSEHFSSTVFDTVRDAAVVFGPTLFLGQDGVGTDRQCSDLIPEHHPR